MSGLRVKLILNVAEGLKHLKRRQEGLSVCGWFGACAEDKALHTVDELRNIRTTPKWWPYTSLCTWLCLNTPGSFEALALKSDFQRAAWDMLN